MKTSNAKESGFDFEEFSLSMGNQVDNKFTWVIKNFSSLQSKKIYSDEFLIGGCTWRLKAFPKGNNCASHLSLYLVVANAEYLHFGWRRHAKIFLTVVNQFSEELSQVKELEHWFDQKESDWGYKRMIEIGKLKSKNGGFLVNGEVKIVVEIDVLSVIGELDVPEETQEATPPLKKKKMNDDGVVTSDLLKETPADSVDVNGFQVLPSQSISCLVSLIAIRGKG
ncbi:unnamed protein product [Arabis nemorensis]|uniref:MATH domain-containing protein n=1 Tax=Arabis nemorensis TaxID=586526 RepID=A0A565BXQ6_9BRAS|nr:unnamed protein product [Arabis nemorensis]